MSTMTSIEQSRYLLDNLQTFMPALMLLAGVVGIGLMFVVSWVFNRLR